MTNLADLSDDLSRNYVTLKEMAEMHRVTQQALRMILWQDQGRPEVEKRLPGAVKLGGERRGTWYIPRPVAEQWQRSPRGRPRTK